MILRVSYGLLLSFLAGDNAPTMKRVLTAVVLIPIVLLIVFRAPMWLFAAFLAVVALIASSEYLSIVGKFSTSMSKWPPLVATAAIFGYTAYREATLSKNPELTLLTLLAIIAIATLVPFIFLSLRMNEPQFREEVISSALAYFAIPYVGLALWSLIVVRHLQVFLVLFVLVVVWVGDTCAYYIGRSMGRHLMAPRVSPKKTWEGAIASILGGVLGGVLAIHYAPEIAQGLLRAGLLAEAELGTMGSGLPGTTTAAVIAFFVNVAAQVGDLVESMIKRGADVKDSGTLLPGHGGILDRIDALLFAAPVAALLFVATYQYWGGPVM